MKQKFHFTSILWKHNTEFSPKLCTVCKCKDGILECSENCEDEEETFDDVESLNSNLIQTSFNERKLRLNLHHKNHKIRNSEFTNIPLSLLKSDQNLDKSELIRAVCYHNEQLHAYNSTWSPLKCTQCKCGFNSHVDCYVLECPPLDCSNVIAFIHNKINKKDFRIKRFCLKKGSRNYWRGLLSKVQGYWQEMYRSKVRPFVSDWWVLVERIRSMWSLFVPEWRNQLIQRKLHSD